MNKKTRTLKQAQRMIIRQFPGEIPAQFARITLEELGIRSDIQKESNERLFPCNVQLLVGKDDANIADEILSRYERYQERLLRKCRKPAEGKIIVLKSIPGS
ncbi:MAG: hypothetical protein JW928_00120 [Candidatus Aureabacteria bacterium]|nr:hypothetical protein [Candidatus Auribacterota bacterium]